VISDCSLIERQTRSNMRVLCFAIHTHKAGNGPENLKLLGLTKLSINIWERLFSALHAGSSESLTNKIKNLAFAIEEAKGSLDTTGLNHLLTRAMSVLFTCLATATTPNDMTSECQSLLSSVSLNVFKWCGFAEILNNATAEQQLLQIEVRSLTSKFW